MGRQLGVIAIGAIAGLIFGVLAPISFLAACVWDGRLDWSSITKPAFILLITAFTTLGTINGVFGARDGWRSRLCRMWTVAIVTSVPFLFPLILLVMDPSDSKMWGPALIMIGIMTPFIWVAGRAGQEIGVRGRNRSLNGQPSPS